MKRITASEARKQWFRLLEEVVAGEVVVLERKGLRVVLRREETQGRQREQPEIDYHKLLRVPAADRADQWTWEWHGKKRM